MHTPEIGGALADISKCPLFRGSTVLKNNRRLGADTMASFKRIHNCSLMQKKLLNSHQKLLYTIAIMLKEVQLVFLIPYVSQDTLCLSSPFHTIFLGLNIPVKKFYCVSKYIRMVCSCKIFNSLD